MPHDGGYIEHPNDEEVLPNKIEDVEYNMPEIPENVFYPGED